MNLLAFAKAFQTHRRTNSGVNILLEITICSRLKLFACASDAARRAPEFVSVTKPRAPGPRQIKKKNRARSAPKNLTVTTLRPPTPHAGLQNLCL
jgi:hypothetical protein